ncbi:unnamed protein product [Oncorhynchus mykiss]|uniref:Copper type II ascorbate-dependent monooxygenase C-terminal domain-containing protein n=1 Tax=Oncorhynchus mykiss TaxID=8022 RepID=A0A060YBL1_ONCMY|nr:unnamed protein product [Oncorhynchus mykiss]
MERTLTSCLWMRTRTLGFINLETIKTIKPGDEIVVECTYNTATRKGITQLGLATTEEMCLAFIIYYPAISVNKALKLDFGFNSFHSSHYNEPGLLLFLLPASTDVYINVSR